MTMNPCNEIPLSAPPTMCSLTPPESLETSERRVLLARVIAALHGADDPRCAAAMGNSGRDWTSHFLDFDQYPTPIQKGIGKKKYTEPMILPYQKALLAACGVPKGKLTTFVGVDRSYGKTHAMTMMLRLRALQNELDGKTFHREYLGSFDSERGMDFKTASACGVEIVQPKVIVWDSLSDAAGARDFVAPKQQPYVKLPDGKRYLLCDDRDNEVPMVFQ